MAFEEITKAPSSSELNELKRRYRATCKKYDDLKYKFQDHISWDDFEVLKTDDFLKLKELYIMKKQLYWKIHAMENPEDKATEKAYRFLNTMSHNDQTDFLMKHQLTTNKLIDAIRENPNFIDEVTA